MALQRDTKYPGRFTTATTEHPQGPFKNRTSSTSQDGSYLEKDWLNDWDGFFGSLLSAAGYVADGNVDGVGASQYFNAFRKVQAAIVGSARNLKCSITAAASTATFTADELVVETALGGLKYQINGLSKTINLATTGAGGMDTGSAPASGYLAIYAILNTTTGATALLATNATSSVAPEVYGGSNMPSGYTASALLAVIPTTSGSLFTVGYVDGRDFYFPGSSILSTTTVQASLTPLSISGVVPKNAKAVSGYASVNGFAAVSNNFWQIAGSASGVGEQAFGTNNSGNLANFNKIPLVTTQTIYYLCTTSSTPMYAAFYLSMYSI